MRRTKTEIFLDILKALILNGPLRVTHLMRKANIHFDDLQSYLTFAMNNFAVNKKGHFYTITPMGILLYKTLNKFSTKKGK